MLEATENMNSCKIELVIALEDAVSIYAKVRIKFLPSLYSSYSI